MYSETSALLSSFRSVKLENKGAVARDHLANERTFLAWLRTSLSFTSIGIAITQFFRLQSSKNLHSLLVSQQDSFDSDLKALVHEAVKNDERLAKFSTTLGVWFIATGIVVILLGCWRYFLSQYHLKQGNFPASRFSISVTFLVTLSLIVASFAIILKSSVR